MPPQLLIQVDTKMVNLFGQCVQIKQTNSRVVVWQNDGASPLKGVRKPGVTYASCLCFLPLTQLSICFSEVFCLFSLLYSAHNSEMLFTIKQPFSSETLQSFLFVCVFVLTQCMNIDKTNCAAQWIFFLPIFHPFT